MPNGSVPDPASKTRDFAMGFARKLYEASAAEVWRAVRRRALGRHCARESVAPRRFEPVTRAFLESAEYRRLMAEHLPRPGAYDRHEAQNETRNYRFRHAEASERLGVFRWRGIQEHLHRRFRRTQPVAHLDQTPAEGQGCAALPRPGRDGRRRTSRRPAA